MQDKKTFVIDTSVLLYNASSIRAFGSKNVVIPYAVLEELDTFKSREGEVGKNARQVVRELNELRKSGSLSEGVKVTPKEGILVVKLCRATSAHSALNLDLADDKILSVAMQVQETLDQMSGTNKVVLVTKDINLAVKAEAIGLLAQDFNSDRLVDSASDLYTGRADISVPVELIDRVFSEEVYTSEIEEYSEDKLFVNQYINLKGEGVPGKSALIRIGTSNDRVKILTRARPCWNVTPRNREQNFAFDALMDTSIPLVTLTGLAGSGKSLLALACALDLVHDQQVYDRLVVSRPVQPMGKDIGYLPGTVQEKLDPWMGPLKDSINFLTSKGRETGNSTYEHMIDTGMLEVEALTYIRGRSMPNTLFLLDEAQDLTRAEIKTIISRMGDNSKLIITGDVMQISNPYLDATNTGLASVVERFKGHRVAAHVTLEKGERSELATIASEIL